VIKCPKRGDNALAILIKADSVVTKSSAIVWLKEETGYVRKTERLVLSTTPCVRLCTLHLCRKYVEQTQSTRERSNVESGNYACKNEVRS
jgi:hypothetical protein